LFVFTGLDETVLDAKAENCEAIVELVLGLSEAQTLRVLGFPQGES
jgi:hypothetical protein